MKTRKLLPLVLAALAFASGNAFGAAQAGVVRLKDLSRPRDERPNALVGYGLVTGLAGTGDNPANRLTGQTISNLLQNLGINVPQQSLRSRNVAAVMVTASLPRYAQSGDFIDVNVTSLGDARSLVGGTLLMTPLKGANGEIFALAQGALSVGGYKYELNGNVVQKNHPTAGNIPNGATVEHGVPARDSGPRSSVEYVLFDPDLMTVTRIVDAINGAYGAGHARVIDPGRYEVSLPDAERSRAFEFLARMESLVIAPDQRARVVVNERTGTVVSGGDVRISQTTISHGDLVVAIKTDYTVSQPGAIFGPVVAPSVSTVVVPNTRIDVSEREPVAVNLPTDTTVAELVAALNRVKASSRDVITILQGLKTAGALHAELVIQ
jgi:flagellar P-ring protein precursor FlgI